MILLARFICDLSLRGLMRDEQFGHRPRYSTSLQLARLVKRIRRNIGEKRLTDAVFLDVAKAFDTFWIDGLYKQIQLNIPVLHSSFNLIVPPSSDVRSVPPDVYVISSGWGESGWTHLPCPLQSVCQRHALTFLPLRVITIRE